MRVAVVVRASSRNRLDPPRHFAAYLHALRWNAVTSTDARLFQAPFRARDGRVIVNQVFASLFRTAGRRYALIVGRDVTQSERTRLLQQAILNNASIGIAVTRADRFEALDAIDLKTGREFTLDATQCAPRGVHTASKSGSVSIAGSQVPQSTSIGTPSMVCGSPVPQ